MQPPDTCLEKIHGVQNTSLLYINFDRVTLCLQYTVREAAKAADLWKTAPYLDDISPQQMKTFYDTVSYESTYKLHAESSKCRVCNL